MVADWNIYLVRCADGTLYTGISTDVERRLSEHECGRKGAKYLRGRGPLTLAFEYRVGSRSQASRIEYQVKRLSPAEKQDTAFLVHFIDAALAD
jgi:putative endonuclease